jgi:hypothetical protein
MVDNAACPDAGVFNGVAMIGSLGFQLPGLGAGCGNVRLGNTISAGPVVSCGWAQAIGLGIGMGAYIGASAVVWSSVESCGC